MGGIGRDSCEQYNINDDKWTSIANLNQKKSLISAYILKNRFIYVFGGYEIETIEEYEILQRQEWKLLELKLP